MELIVELGGVLIRGSGPLCAHSLPPQVLDLLDCGLFSGGQVAKVPQRLAMALLEMDAMMNDVVARLAIEHTMLCRDTDHANDDHNASGFAMILKGVGLAPTWLSQEQPALKEASLRISLPVCAKWVSCVAALAEVLQHRFVEKVLGEVRAVPADSERLCSQWGDANTYKQMIDDSSCLQPIKNPCVQKLPAARRSLESKC